MRKDYENNYYEEESEGLDFVDLIFTFLRRWKIIVLMTIPMIIIGFFVASTRPTVYQAQTTMIISAGDGLSTDGSHIGNGQKFITTYIQLAKSRDIMERVISKYDLTSSPESLASKVTVSPVGDTDFLKLSYKSNKKGLTVAVANEITNEFIFKVGQVLRVRNISIVEKAIEAKQLPKNRGTIIVAFTILGLALGLGAVFIIEMVHKKLRKPSEIEKILGVEMLGMISEIENKEESNE